jgi:hypothetical protein
VVVAKVMAAAIHVGGGSFGRVEAGPQVGGPPLLRSY